MINYLYAHMHMFTVISVSSLLDISQNGTNRPESGRTNRTFPSKGPRSLRKFVQSSACIGKEKYMHHRKFSEKEASFWIKMKSFLYC